MSAAKEGDGDWHIRLDLDAEFADMLNEVNKSGQRALRSRSDAERAQAGRGVRELWAVAGSSAGIQVAMAGA